ncbi:hypothetical protein BVRB_038410, partial [Beta vulgaris subsp. vulgaris]
MSCGRQSRQLLSHAVAAIDNDGDGTVSLQELQRFMATTGLHHRYTTEICAFLHTWMREKR